MTQSCDSSINNFAGVAALNSAKTQLVMFMSTPDEASGVLVNLLKKIRR